MTALMAFFLVLWILSIASEEERRGVAEYFSTPLVNAVTGGERAGSTSAIREGYFPSTTVMGMDDFFAPNDNRTLVTTLTHALPAFFASLTYSSSSVKLGRSAVNSALRPNSTANCGA